MDKKCKRKAELASYCVSKMNNCSFILAYVMFPYSLYGCYVRMTQGYFHEQRQTTRKRQWRKHQLETVIFNIKRSLYPNLFGHSPVCSFAEDIRYLGLIKRANKLLFYIIHSSLAKMVIYMRICISRT